MNKATLKALQRSILRWAGITAGVDYDDNDASCPLCIRFSTYDCSTPDGREMCPIKLKTGRGNCLGTPYIAWNKHMGPACDEGCYARNPKERGLAMAQLTFLVSLLPEELDK